MEFDPTASRWHISHGKLIKEVFYPVEKTDEVQTLRDRLMGVVIAAMNAGTLWVGDTATNDNIQDREEEINSIVLHHTSGGNEFWSKSDTCEILLHLNALQLLRLTAFYRGYKPALTDNNEFSRDLNLGRVFPLSHPLAGSHNFIQYHFIVLPNGEVVKKY
jgi:hypothetical protein